MAVTSMASMDTMVRLCSFCASSVAGFLNQIVIFLRTSDGSNYRTDYRNNLYYRWYYE